MPIMGGFEAAHKIRKREEKKGVKKSILIACSAEPIFNEEDNKKYIEKGFDLISIII